MANMRKSLLVYILLLVTFNLIAQNGRHIPNSDISKLIGTWKAVTMRMTDDNDSNKIIQINLMDPKSTKFFSDTVFYNGLYGKLKAEADTNLQAKMLLKQSNYLFADMDKTFVTFNQDSTYALNNQPTLFGFVANGTLFKTITGRKWGFFFGEKSISRTFSEKSLSFNVARDDDRYYVVVKLTEDILIIDEGWRDVNGSPVKEITFSKQKKSAN